LTKSLTTPKIQHAGITATGFTTLEIGKIGVEVFFVLSGFLIGGILFREFEKENSFASIKRFWIRRWFRILPVYYLFLLIKCIMDPSIGWDIFYFIFFLQNNFGPGIDFFGVTWSLVIEEWFYIVAPIFIMVAYKITKNLKVVSLFILGFIVFENVIRYLYATKTGVPFEGISGSVPFRFDSLFIGMALAFIKHHFKGLFKKLQSHWVLLCGIVGLTSYLFYIYSISHPVDNFANYLLPKTLGFFLLSFFMALFIPFFVHWTSLLTYAIYLSHMLFFSPIIKSNLFGDSYFIKVSVSVILTYLASYVIYRYFEKPVLQLRERFS